MKKYVLSIVALTLAVFFSSFELLKPEIKRTTVCKYFIYFPAGFSCEITYSNYIASSTMPPASFCPSDGRVCWILVCDQDGDGDVDEDDFNMVVPPLDFDQDCLISDDLTENHVTYEERN